MDYQNIGKRRGYLLASALGLAGCMLSVPAWAVTFSTPDGVSGTPQTETTGGATRDGGQCLVGSDIPSEDAIARLPKNNNLLLNEGKEPTFVVYVPESTAREASFTLQDESQNMIYQTKVPLPEAGGVISISLEKSPSELEIGKDYKWLLEIHCTQEFSPENPIYGGWVRAI